MIVAVAVAADAAADVDVVDVVVAAAAAAFDSIGLYVANQIEHIFLSAKCVSLFFGFVRIPVYV